MKNIASKSFQTRAVHSGELASGADYTPVTTPISTAVGYIYDSMDDMDAVFAGTKPGYVYVRYSNPTVTAFEEAVASLEGAEAAQAYSSGMAAIHAALLGCGARAGASVVAALDVYGATFTMLKGLFKTLGVNATLLNISDPAEVESVLKEVKPVCLYVETISNPLLKVADIPALAVIAHRYNTSLLVDNTFASPYLFTPLSHGADYTIHSATKYISGHGDVLAGVVATSTEKKKVLFELNKLVGGVLGSFEAYLALRGLKTLPLRVAQQCRNAQSVAEWLQKHPRIKKVNYPGLPDHPGHVLAEKLFEGRGYGGVLSFELDGAGKAQVYRFMEALTLFLPATTLGDISSLVLHPATSSHRGLTPDERARVGIPDGLVRLSLGIESTDDLLSDLESALANK
jgi:cystathionine beta-lyase/cystathionine gamma-synthase